MKVALPFAPYLSHYPSLIRCDRIEHSSGRVEVCEKAAFPCCTLLVTQSKSDFHYLAQTAPLVILPIKMQAHAGTRQSQHEHETNVRKEKRSARKLWTHTHLLSVK